MKLRTASLSLLVSCLILAAIPASAQIECSIGGGLYFNGPVNGQVAQLPINGGGSVIDSIQLNGTVTDLCINVWLIPSDTITSLQVTIFLHSSAVPSFSPPASQIVFNGVLNVVVDSCVVNFFGYNVCAVDAAFNGPTLNGIYWLMVQNAVVTGGTAGWDVNSGVGCDSLGCPSQAFASGSGTSPVSSESFVVR